VVVLFHSLARGDARHESDYDVAMFNRGKIDRTGYNRERPSCVNAFYVVRPFQKQVLLSAPRFRSILV
jgi:hypothetical protein